MGRSNFIKAAKIIGIIVLHVSAWGVYVSLPHLLYDLPIEHFNLSYRAVELALAAFFFYTCYYILVPVLVMRRKIAYYAAIVAACLAATHYLGAKTAPLFPAEEQVVMRVETTSLAAGRLTMEHTVSHRSAHKPGFAPNLPRMLSFSMLLIFAVSTSASLARHYYKEERKSKETEREKLASELQFLKSQINPHFLFNALNNIYGLSLKKSDVLPGIVLKLSDMLRYMLYESEQDSVPLQSEIGYIQNYIDIQEIRLGGSMDLSFVQEGDFKNKHISPLLLIPFVENVFKHGTSTKHNSYAYIHMKIDGSTLIFKTDNPYQADRPKSKDGGIGSQNVRRRLELLYPGRFSLATSAGSGRYTVQLVLQLKDAPQHRKI
jgi:two-component system, LytTR family, sensor kinase